MEGVYGGAWYMGKRGGLWKCKESCRGIWGEDECWSKKTREVGHGRKKRL